MTSKARNNIFFFVAICFSLPKWPSCFFPAIFRSPNTILFRLYEGAIEALLRLG